MTDMSEPLRLELFQEMMRAHEVIQKVFQPTKMNMCSLGNVVEHIHWHFFPRYKEDENFKNPPWLQMHEFEKARIDASERDKLVEMMKPLF
jgi:diadenosine tetraphosphate (Ap4A) HIT family hydrolase